MHPLKIVFCVSAALFAAVGFVAADIISESPPPPRERPVLTGPTGPLAPVPVYSPHLDRHRYAPSPLAWPYGPGRLGWWGAGYPGFNFTHALYPFRHDPIDEGVTTVWVAAGSQSYLGGGLMTVQPIEDTAWAVHFAMSHEQGRDWFWNDRYTHDAFATGVSWHGERTSVYVGAAVDDVTFSGRPTTRSAERWREDGSSSALRTGNLRLQQQLSDRIDVSVGVQSGKLQRD